MLHNASMASADLPPTASEVDELRASWTLLNERERLAAFAALPRDLADDLFMSLESWDQYELLQALPEGEKRIWMRLLPPDDAADLVQNAPHEQRTHLLQLLDDATRREVTALLAYQEDQAGGLMSPRFARLRPDMTVDEAISYSSAS